MSVAEPSFTIGIEEEYLLVDLESRDLVTSPPESFFEDCRRRLGERVVPEFLRCQVEVGTQVCLNVEEARASLLAMRREIAGAAFEQGMAPIACGTHPFADWDLQRHTDKERYNNLVRDMQVVARRMLICGMHVHVAIEDEALRADLFDQVVYFLPHLLALSTSSPFWRGRRTGLASYRLAVFDELPRTGLPERFDSPAEMARTIDVLVATGLIEDASKVWWDVRPSARFPTLELRIADACPRLEDAVGIAALFVCLLRMLYRLRMQNMRWRNYSRLLIAENRWLAQRNGARGELIDFGRNALVPYAQLLEEMIELTREDAEALGCAAAIAHLRNVAQEGTSSDRQLAAFESALAAGEDEAAALRHVVDGLIAETSASTEAKETNRSAVGIR